MTRPVILMGDTLDHGGSVVSGSTQTSVDGVPVARIGDKVICGKHGPTVIVTGDSGVLIDGQPVARHGDKTGCGGSLIAGQTSPNMG